MSSLAAVLVGQHPGGIYRFASTASSQQVAQLAESAGRAYLHLDGAADKADALAQIADQLGFADYFGANLDALVDSVSDVAQALVVLWDEPQLLARADETAYEAITEILAEHRDRISGVSSVVLLRDADAQHEVLTHLG